MNSDFPNSGAIINIGLTTYWVNNWYLRSSVGFNTIKEELAFTRDDDFYDGTYIREQIFVSIAFERKLLDSDTNIFINAGLGFYHSIKSGFESGYNRKDWTALGLVSEPNPFGSRLGLEVNCRIVHPLNARVGTMINFGLHYFEIFDAIEIFPPLTTLEFAIQLGLSYNLN